MNSKFLLLVAACSALMGTSFATESQALKMRPARVVSEPFQTSFVEASSTRRLAKRLKAHQEPAAGAETPAAAEAAPAAETAAPVEAAAETAAPVEAAAETAAPVEAAAETAAPVEETAAAPAEEVAAPAEEAEAMESELAAVKEQNAQAEIEAAKALQREQEVAEELKLASEEAAAETAKAEAEARLQKEARDAEEAELLKAESVIKNAESMWGEARDAARIAHEKAKHAREAQMKAELARVKEHAVKAYATVMQQHKHPLMHNGVDVLPNESAAEAILSGVAEGSHTQNYDDVLETENREFTGAAGKKPISGDSTILTPQ